MHLNYIEPHRILGILLYISTLFLYDIRTRGRRQREICKEKEKNNEIRFTYDVFSDGIDTNLALIGVNSCFLREKESTTKTSSKYLSICVIIILLIVRVKSFSDFVLSAGWQSGHASLLCQCNVFYVYNIVIF